MLWIGNKCDKIKVMRISRQPSYNTDCDSSETAEKCGIFQIFG
jgi:hypothetical protein